MADLFTYTLVPTAVYATAESKTFDEIPLVRVPEYLLVVMTVTNAANTSGDKLDVYIDISPDDGGSWINAVHFTQVLGDGLDALKFCYTLGGQRIDGNVVNVTADATAGTARPTLVGSRMRARHVLVDDGSHGQTFTYGVMALSLPRR